MLHRIINHTSWNYNETIKKNLPLCVTELMDLGAEVPSMEQRSLRLSYSTHLYLGHLMTKIIDIAEGNLSPLIQEWMPFWNIAYFSYTDLGCNSISLAILRKSEVDLQQALTVSPSSINETNNMGQSALHLAVEWPRGMDLLLQAGADVNCRDSRNYSPLFYAVEMSLVEPINLLALADCSLLDAGAQFLFERAENLAISAHPNQGQVTAAEMVVNILVDMIADRRQRLYNLANSALPVSDLDRLCHDSYLPDESASRLYSALLRHGNAVPLALDPGKYRATLFHQIRTSSRVAERLWKAGFREIDGRDSWGRTPLMCAKIGDMSPINLEFWLEYVAWLLEKGADFYAKQDLTLYCEHFEVDCRSEVQLMSATAVHFVAYEVGSGLRWALNGLGTWVEESLSRTSKKMLQRVLMDNVSDACMCACSISGCNALTMITKRYNSYRVSWERHSQGLVDFWSKVKSFCDPLKISELLRIMTFEGLGMTHTCCYFYDRSFSIKNEAEIDEIHDEEAEDLQKLEELLEEFEAKRNELDIPFEDFLTEYWQPRMKEVLEEGALDEDALREIGVQVY